MVFGVRPEGRNLLLQIKNREVVCLDVQMLGGHHRRCRSPEPASPPFLPFPGIGQAFPRNEGREGEEGFEKKP